MQGLTFNTATSREGEIMAKDSKNAVVKAGNCEDCEHSSFCVIAMVFELMPNCQGVIFDQYGCGADKTTKK
jgi:hypothetical protein